MKCPACGAENIRGVQQCASCARLLDPSQNPPAAVEIRVSRIAIASSICTLIGLIFFVLSLIAWLDPLVLHPQSKVALFTGFVTFMATGSALILGIAGLIEIATSGGRWTGYAYAVFGTVAPIVLVLGLLSPVSPLGFHSHAYRMTCGTNLSGIGKAMLTYARDYDDMLPRAGGPNARWVARLPSWAAENRSDAYGWSDPNAGDGQASVSASLYLFVKYAGVEPKKFVCSQDSRIREFKPRKYGVRDREPSALWDFGPNPPMHCSYAYHMPYGPNRLTLSFPPGFAVAADRNPWMDSPFARAGDFSRYKPDIPPFGGNSGEAKNGNAAAHERDGQNVLFLDSHVEFAKRAYCGLDDDNIYTTSTSATAGDPQGIPPKLGSQPANRRDSLLVNDPPAPRQ